jgi:hypothetical protein
VGTVCGTEVDREESMKTIDKDEWYPVYCIRDRPDYADDKEWRFTYPIIKINKDLQNRYDNIFKQFNELQDELAKMLGQARSTIKKKNG